MPLAGILKRQFSEKMAPYLTLTEICKRIQAYISGSQLIVLQRWMFCQKEVGSFGSRSCMWVKWHVGGWKRKAGCDENCVPEVGYLVLWKKTGCIWKSGRPSEARVAFRWKRGIWTEQKGKGCPDSGSICHLPHALPLSFHQQAVLHFLTLFPLWPLLHLPLMYGKRLHLVWSLRLPHCHLEHTNWSLILIFAWVYLVLLSTQEFAAKMENTPRSSII